MKKIRMKKSVFVTTILATSLVFGSVGAYSATGLQKITAQLNHDIQFKLNGSAWTPRNTDGSRITPITYNGTTYLPARAIADAVGTEVGWNGSTKTISIGEGSTGGSTGAVSGSQSGTSAGSSAGSSASPSTGTAPAGTSKNKGSLSDPIAIGTSYTYTDTYSYKPEVNGSYGATYTITLNKVASLSADGFKKLGLTSPDNFDEVDYKLVTLTMKISNAWFKAGSEETDMYLSMFRPSIWGTRAVDNSSSVIGVQDYGFDGSLSSNNSDQTVGVKVAPGQKKSYEVTGKAIVGVPKGQQSVLAFRKTTPDLEYEESFIYYSLK
ncbi:stalk domain-containing protein [Paenibacillus sambharensis]|nr:stalk domain-containing protein [Paenibacillus sambharensis]